ncbi:MAG: hypothetical protein U0Q21_02315 [Dermatophilaceae bacterium]
MAEHRPLGIPLPATGERFDLLEDQLEILTLIMTGDVISYAGRRVSLSAGRMRPEPVQRPHPGSGDHRRGGLTLARRHGPRHHLAGDVARLVRCRHSLLWLAARGDAQVELFATAAMPGVI